MTDIFLEVQNLALKFKHLGSDETTYARLYGRAQHIAPQAWLHAIFKPLNEEEVDFLKEKLPNFPIFYQNFLKLSNGFSLFGSTLSFYGYRREYIRDFDSVWQPFDIIDLNTFDRPSDSKKTNFFFASYSWDGSYVYYDIEDNKVKRCSCDSISPLNIWEDIESFIYAELGRISKLFRDDGVKINEDIETSPR